MSEKDILDDFFSNVDRIVKDYENRGRPNHKNPNALKRYIPPNDNPILKLPRKPEKVVLHWTEIQCICGQVFRTPTYPGASAFLHWPHHTKKGVIDIIPLRRYQVIPKDLPIFEEWQIHHVDICHNCFVGHQHQLELFQHKTTSLEIRELVIKPELPSEDVRDHLDDPEAIILADYLDEMKGEE